MSTVHKKRKTDNGYQYREVNIRKLASGGYAVVVHEQDYWFKPIFAFADCAKVIDAYLDNGYTVRLGRLYEASYLAEILNKETAQ